MGTKFFNETPLGEVVSVNSGLTELEIKKLKNLFDENEKNVIEGLVGRSREIDKELRISSLIWLDAEFCAERPEIQDIVFGVMNTFDEINESLFQFDLFTCEALQLTRYDSSEKEHYAMHTDCRRLVNNFHRKLSFSIMLSDPEDYEGGDFVYYSDREKPVSLRNDRPDKIQKGQILAFPSFMVHGVTPVTKGVRYSLVGWCSGPRFK